MPAAEGRDQLKPGTIDPVRLAAFEARFLRRETIHDIMARMRRRACC